MKNMMKSVAILLAVVLLVGAVIGGTLAWFTDKTQEVKNTFTVGNIDIELEESDNGLDSDDSADTNDYKMIPGWTIEKDPMVTVKANSEKCYVFVEMIESENFDSFMTYEMAEGWTALSGKTGVYYRVVETGTADQEFQVILGDDVVVSEEVTKVMMDELGADRTKYPTLNVTAYAVQYMNSNNDYFEPAEAWNIAKSAT